MSGPTPAVGRPPSVEAGVRIAATANLTEPLAAPIELETSAAGDVARLVAGFATGLAVPAGWLAVRALRG